MFTFSLNRFPVILPLIPQLFFQLGNVPAGSGYLLVYFPDLLVQEADDLFTRKDLFGEQVQPVQRVTRRLPRLVQ